MAKDVENVEGFLIEDIVSKNGEAYFACTKLAELLGIELTDIDMIFADNPQILKWAIGVTDYKTNEHETYIDIEGCLNVALKCPENVVGEDFHTDINMFLELMHDDDPRRATNYDLSEKADVFLKAIFAWSFDIYNFSDCLYHSKVWSNNV